MFLGCQELGDHLAVGLAAGGFHDLAGEHALQFGFAFDEAVANNELVTPPAGATVDEPDLLAAPDTDRAGSGESSGYTEATDADVERPQVVGEGWARVLVLAAGLPDALGAATGAATESDPATDTATDAAGGPGGDLGTLDMLLAAMPEVSGDWGSGRLLSTHLLTVLVTDDGRTLSTGR